MNEAARQEVRRQAGFRCEYCRIHERHLPFSTFHLDHVIARQHAGTNDSRNLAWTCQECNLLKGTNLSTIDPDAGAVVLLLREFKRTISQLRSENILEEAGRRN